MLFKTIFFLGSKRRLKFVAIMAIRRIINKSLTGANFYLASQK